MIITCELLWSKITSLEQVFAWQSFALMLKSSTKSSSLSDRPGKDEYTYYRKNINVTMPRRHCLPPQHHCIASESAGLPSGTSQAHEHQRALSACSTAPLSQQCWTQTSCKTLSHSRYSPVIALFSLLRESKLAFDSCISKIRDHLYMKENGGIVAVLLYNVENMLKHPSADAKPSVWRQAPQCHYVQLEQNVSLGKKHQQGRRQKKEGYLRSGWTRRPTP